MSDLSLFRRDPFGFGFGFESGLPRLLRDLARADESGVARGAAAFVPSFDVKETAEGFVLTADLPGVKPEDVEVSVNGNLLTVSGKRQVEERKEGESFHQIERSYGSFRRLFTLPDNVSPDVEAQLRDGVLTLTVPKRPESKPRQITVKTA
ncbi:MAG: Hsp20/alpha crystallin family protein [Polyangiaceae bacterium]|nr:Hsp20/alpha crystallin family protein [Polyangiaceae bacterium]MCW5789389.1 Hsp20/alpha crystallin family protein [Polyangiaceae bacterium]